MSKWKVSWLNINENDLATAANAERISKEFECQSAALDFLENEELSINSHLWDAKCNSYAPQCCSFETYQYRLEPSCES